MSEASVLERWESEGGLLEPDFFVPSSDWQPAPEGIVYPSGNGLHVQMNQTTGRTEVAWENPPKIKIRIPYPPWHPMPEIRVDDLPTLDQEEVERIGRKKTQEQVLGKKKRKWPECLHELKAKGFSEEWIEELWGAAVERKFDDGPRITPEQAEAARVRAQKKQNQGGPNGAASKREEKADNDPNWFDSVETISITELLAIDRQNDPNCLLGNRWLCRGYQVAIHGETGIGKSSLVLQATILWALGEAFFGIRPKRSLKALFIEAENDKGDLAEVFQDVVKAMKLRSDQIDWLNKKVIIVRERLRTGKSFVRLAEGLIKKFGPDLVFADPLLAYVGDDLSQQKAMSTFLRAELQPVIDETGIIWFWVHHVSKPPRDDKTPTRRGTYAGLGSIELSASARETISINKLDWDTRLFELEFGKRSKRLGICDEAGKPIEKLYVRQSTEGTFWEAVDQTEAAKQSGKANQSAKATKMVRVFIEKKVNVTHPQLRQYAKQISVGQNAAIEIARAIVDDKSEPRIYEYKIKLSRTNASNTFSTVKEEDNPFTFNRKSGRK